MLVENCSSKYIIVHNIGLSIDWSKKNKSDVDVLISAGISPRPHKKLTSNQNFMR